MTRPSTQSTSASRKSDTSTCVIPQFAIKSNTSFSFDLNLTDAIVRGRYRATRDHAVLLEPGKVYPFTIEPFPTANVFKKGHRIRVDVSSSNYPRFDVNPNTGDPLGEYRRMAPADNTVYHDAAHPSQVVLPVVPGSS